MKKRMWAGVLAALVVMQVQAAGVQHGQQEVCKIERGGPIIFLPEDDTGGLLGSAPAYQPAAESMTVLSSSCRDCAQEIKGAALSPSGFLHMLTLAKGKVLLASTIQKLESLSVDGSFSTGAFWFPLPQNIEQVNALFDGKHLEYKQDDPITGIAQYQRLDGQGMMHIQVQAWQVDMPKRLPRTGLNATLHYARQDNGSYVLQDVKMLPGIPLPPLVMFEGFHGQPYLYRRFGQEFAKAAERK